MVVYKIRDKITKLFWEGSIRDAYNDVNKLKFSAKGKQWKEIRHCKMAIRSHGTICEARNYLWENCEIVKFELKEIETINW